MQLTQRTAISVIGLFRLASRAEGGAATSLARTLQELSDPFHLLCLRGYLDPFNLAAHSFYSHLAAVLPRADR
jgi:hypothetical protein